jgi:hypothetical protein
MRLQMEMAEKLAERFGSHAAFKAKPKQGGHDQADEPGSACLRFPKCCLRVAGAAIDRLEVTMHAAFRESGALRKMPDTLRAVFTNHVENANAFSPQSPGVDPCSEGWLNSCRNSAFQST